MPKRFLTIFFITSILLINAKSFAGNHEVVHPVTGESIGWTNPNAIPYWVDKGGLGVLMNEEAATLVAEMFKIWEGTETASVGFLFHGFLKGDVDVSNISDYLAATGCGASTNSDIPENVVPIVFDSDGKILEYLTGLGSSAEIGGVSTLRCFLGSASNPTSIHQGMVIINGQFIDGKGSADSSPVDLTVNGIAGVILHETGHLIGLDHTALNEDVYTEIQKGLRSAADSRYLPVMLPTVLRSSTASTTLHPDDVASLSSLYPNEKFLTETGAIGGEVVDSRGDEVRKVNVIARNEEDPLCEAYASLTGRRCTPLLDAYGNPNFNSTTCDNEDQYGDFIVEGLPEGSYTVEVENLPSGWIRMGMYPGYVDEDLPGEAEFYNDEDAADEDFLDYDLVDVFGGEIAVDIDFILSDYEADKAQLDRIPLVQFSAGTGSRCIEDLQDYTDLLQNAEEIMTALGESGTFDGEGSGLTKGGCQLNPSSEFNFFSTMVLFLFTTIPFLLKKFFCVRGLTVLLRSVCLSFPCVIVFSLFSLAQASSVIPTTLDGMTGKAGKIFYGKCSEVRVEKDERGLVSTYVTFDIVRGAKGVGGESTTVKIFGNASRDSENGQPTIRGISPFSVGEEGVFFLYSESPWGYTSPVGLWQGNFPVVKTEEGPRLSRLADSYKRTLISPEEGPQKSKYAVTAVREINTPDELLDEVERILRKSIDQ